MTRNDWWGGVIPFGFGLRSRLTALGRARRWPGLFQAAPVLGVAPVLLLLSGPPKSAQPPDLVLDLAHGGYTGQPVDWQFHETTFFALLMDIGSTAGIEIGRAESLQDATFPLRSHQIPWDRTLDGLLRRQGARLALRGGELVVVPITDLHATGADADAGPLGSRSFPFPSADTAALGAWVVRASLSERGDVTVDQRWNALTVKDVAWRLDTLAPVLARIAARPPAPVDRSVITDVVATADEISVSLAKWQPPDLDPARYKYELMVYRVPLDLARELRVGPGGVTPWQLTARDVAPDELERLRGLQSRPGVTLVTVPLFMARAGEVASVESAAPVPGDPPSASAFMDAHREAGHVQLRLDVAVGDSAAHYQGHADAPVLLGFPLRNEPDMAGIAVLVVTQDGGHS